MLKVLLIAVALYIVAIMRSLTTPATTATTPASIATTPATTATTPASIATTPTNSANVTTHSSGNQATEASLLLTIQQLKESVLTMRKSKKYLMPVHPEAIRLTTRLQNATRCWLTIHLGENAARAAHILALGLQFPSHMVEKDDWLRTVSNGTGAQMLYIELAPAMLLPCAVYTIMEIALLMKSGHFHRNAGHVMQAMISSAYKGGMVFMEYDRSYRHEKYTWGFAGRGGGNAIYINTMNNTMTHGPGTDRGGKDPESDVVFGRTLSEHGKRIVDSMKRQPGAKGIGFVSDGKNFIRIKTLRVLSQDEMESTQEVRLALESRYTRSNGHWIVKRGDGDGSDGSDGSIEYCSYIK